jgi:hypothetical protein
MACIQWTGYANYFTFGGYKIMSYPADNTAITQIVDGAGYPRATNVNPAFSDLDGVKTMLGVNGIGWIGEGQMYNGKLSVTVAANNLTVAIKTMAGADPSAALPVYVRINGTIRKITAALSVTINAGAASFALGTEMATKEIDLFAYLSYRTASTAVVIGSSRLPYGTLYSDFSATANTYNYAPFSTAPAATDDVVNIGRFAATNSGTASFNWSVPTFNQVNLIQKPCYETRWLTWLPTFTGFTATVPTGTYSYKLIGDICVVDQIAATNGTSNATTFTQTFPFPFAVSNASAGIVNAWDNGAGQATPAQMQSTAGSATAAYYKTFYQVAWTNAGAKNAYCPDFQYRLR